MRPAAVWVHAVVAAAKIQALAAEIERVAAHDASATPAGSRRRDAWRS